MNIYLDLAHIFHELLHANAVFAVTAAEILIGHLVKKLFETVGPDAIITAVFISEQSLRTNERLPSVVFTAEGKIFHKSPFTAEEVAEYRHIDVGPEEASQFLCESLVAFRVDGGVIVEAVNMPA
jgi:hypothetical protein